MIFSIKSIVFIIRNKILNFFQQYITGIVSQMIIVSVFNPFDVWTI